MWCRYNAVDFLHNSHNRHPISLPWGRCMGVFCEFEVWFMFWYRPSWRISLVQHARKITYSTQYSTRIIRILYLHRNNRAECINIGLASEESMYGTAQSNGYNSIWFREVWLIVTHIIINACLMTHVYVIDWSLSIQWESHIVSCISGYTDMSIRQLTKYVGTVYPNGGIYRFTELYSYFRLFRLNFVSVYNELRVMYGLIFSVIQSTFP